MDTRFIYEPLAPSHTEDLAELLLDERVYRHLGGTPPSRERFRLGMQRALAGPGPGRAGHVWVNYAVRDRATQALVGRLEATIHDRVAEVAFLYGPAWWGRGFATCGLRWLVGELLAHPSRPALWATTTAGNRACQNLLARCGFQCVPPQDAPGLVTYDAGDLVFRGPRAP